MSQGIGGSPDGQSGGSSDVDCVVGSGPSGVACASALLTRGRQVHMIDAGVRLEPDRAQVVDRLRATAPAEWDRETLRRLVESEQQPGVLPDKLVFGSRYPYDGVEQHIGQERQGVGLHASLAYGGLSTVWGAAMLASLPQDIADWPVTSEQLARHYESAAELVKPCGDLDDLACLFPLYTESRGSLQLSRQAHVLWSALERGRESLRRSGIHFGRARLAVQVPDAGGASGCVYCTMCLNGCPYGYIYSSSKTVADLRRCDRFSYEADAVVERVREVGDHVVLSGRHRVSGAPFERSASRAYLAAGAIPTTGILLRSLSAYDRTIRMKDSQYFLLPVLLPRGVRGVRQEQTQTLSQIFLELLDPSVSQHAVHLQIYSYSESIGKALRNAMGPLARPLEFLARGLEERLMIIQGFVHSSDSSEILVTLQRRGADGAERLVLQAAPHARATRVVRRVVRKLMAQAHRLGVVPLPIGVHVAEPGRSFHSGGTFPMKANPGAFETDTWGRPAGWRRVHAVDATVLPSVPATTITFTVMANAHRIGWESAGAA